MDAQQDAYEGNGGAIRAGWRQAYPCPDRFQDVVCCEPGRLNLQTGDDYKLDDLKDEAWRIMAVKRKGA